MTVKYTAHTVFSHPCCLISKQLNKHCSRNNLCMISNGRGFTKTLIDEALELYIHVCNCVYLLYIMFEMREMSLNIVQTVLS